MVKGRVRRLALTAVLTLLVLFGLSAGVAHAAATFTNHTPAPGSTIFVSNPLVSVNISDPGGIIWSGRQMKIDGASVAVRYNATTKQLYYQTSMLSAGTHTVLVSTLASNGTRSSTTWTFTVSLKPVLGPLSPADGTTVTTTSPTISVKVVAAGGTPAHVMSVDGKTVPAAYDPVAKVLSYKPARLANDAVHAVSVTVTDTAGYATTAAWSFRIQIYTDMVAAAACADCHPTYPATHPMTNCNACHGFASPIGGYYYPPDYHPAGEAAAFLGNCGQCHQTGTFPTVPDHAPLPVAHATSQDMTGCSCHVKSLTIEHARRKGATGAALDCETCHASTNSAVTAAIAAGDTRCDACHPAGHGDMDAAHLSPTTTSCFGAGCHDASKSLPAVHDVFAGPGTEYGYETSCELCHENRDPNRIDWSRATARCTGVCHASSHADYNTKHTITPASSDCTGCHGTNLSTVHGASADFAKCATCHTRADNWSKNAECMSCHDTASPHGDVAATHGAELGPAPVTVFQWHDEAGVGPSRTTMDCRLCHSTNLTKVHTDCWTCHAAGGPRDSFTTWNGSCQQGACHPTYHDGSGAVHNSVGGGCECHDANWVVTPTSCRGCHGFVDEQAPVTTSNARAAYGGVAKITLTAADNEYGTGVAHTYYRVDGGPQAEGMVVTVPGPATGTVMHSVQFWSVDTAGNAEAPHTVTFSLTTDGVAPTTTSDAVADYVGGAVIHLTPTDPAPSSDVVHTYYRLDGAAQQDGTTIPVYTGGAHTLEFWSVDGAGNVETHTTVDFTIQLDDIAPVTTSNAPAFAARVQPFIDLSASDSGGSGVAHTYWKLDGGAVNESVRLQVYQLGWHTLEFWSVDWAGNEEQHKTATFIVDFLRPTVTTDVQPTYSGTAVIHITATDNAGGSGIDRILYRVDYGTETVGDTVTVTTPGAHRLFYWVRDKAGCEEYGYVDFTVTP